MDRIVLNPAQKALRINLDPNVYGTFAEIGAGQETVRHFFRAGGASGTIAKAMSAYDKDFSDAIYGKEKDNRYVTEVRLRKMLDHEYGLITERLDREKHPDKRFFAFANTVATINFAKTFKGHGWLGLRFQTSPEKEPNEIIIHIRMHENEAKYQQETIGAMGVNLIHGAFHLWDDPRELLHSLYDNISRDAIEVDMINFLGPDFENVDNRLMSLQLIKNGFTDAVIFGPEGNNLLPAEVLYKKNVLALRGSFRPVTKVNIDMIKKGYRMFVKERKVERDKLVVLFEITLNNLLSEGEIDEQDFLDRAEILCSLGQTVLISNYQEYYKLVDYFGRFTPRRSGLIMGIPNLEEIFNEKYYRNLNGGILEAFGKIFSKDIKIYVYPFKPTAKSKLTTSKNLKVHPRFRPIFDYLIYNGRIVDIDDFDESILHIFSREVLRKIRQGEDGWEGALPAYVDNIIKENGLFGFEVQEDVEKGGK
ncbi:TonB-dependent receptor [Phaeocystidibacter luteus]|uniref:TonB-dependent receptor n=1 Tax=Phaeocystidibacter luteus TaxID=911197 RepID=A0A6N6RLK9_9FLAO|nr:TonB-dependent receptor [Phaeocystidibacter luteus]KAB2814459.1 TonB-dependent receptor [Phaeocystidibacter luteus]